MKKMKRAPACFGVIGKVLLLCLPMLCAAITCSAQSNASSGPAQKVVRKAVQSPTKAATAKATPAQSAPSVPKPPAAAFVNCHALETHTSAQPVITVVVFNQRDKNDHVRLSELLKDQPGTVEIKTNDGKWHKATVARLKSCFGRGLLFLSGDMQEPKDRADFLLRFPPKSAS
jgi:hypothetical protein